MMVHLVRTTGLTHREPWVRGNVRTCTDSTTLRDQHNISSRTWVLPKQADHTDHRDHTDPTLDLNINSRTPTPVRMDSCHVTRWIPEGTRLIDILIIRTMTHTDTLGILWIVTLIMATHQILMATMATH